jgi:hypothetical protein
MKHLSLSPLQHASDIYEVIVMVYGRGGQLFLARGGHIGNKIGYAGHYK